ncbi:MAG: SRPBCC family protein [Actinobacteria bacterium]|nr:SRPBCC family protein [Actinomycetota bacterium]
MAHIHHTSRIGATVDQVYRVARDPQTWSTWYVGLEGPESLTGSGEAGTVGNFAFMLAGMRFPVTVEVLEDAQSSDGASWTGRIGGPLEGEHHWTYRPHGDETEVTLDVTYTVPGSALGRLADKIVLEKMMERNMHNSVENLRTVCENC